MAMTKAEKAEMERLRADLALARAMRWPDYPKPASMTRDEILANLVEGKDEFGRPSKVARGWFINSYLGGWGGFTPSYGCSNGYSHNSNGERTTTQQMGVMYATKADALRAVRHELTEKMATILANVDRQIAEEE